MQELRIAALGAWKTSMHVVRKDRIFYSSLICSVTVEFRQWWQHSFLQDYLWLPRAKKTYVFRGFFLGYKIMHVPEHTCILLRMESCSANVSGERKKYMLGHSWKCLLIHYCLCRTAQFSSKVVSVQDWGDVMARSCALILHFDDRVVNGEGDNDGFWVRLALKQTRAYCSPEWFYLWFCF